MKATDFSLPDQDGRIHKLSDYKGKWVVLYFYPKDDTPGCIKEACNFRDSLNELAKMGVIVFGISQDTVESHKKFHDKYNLNFDILSDVDKKAITDYKVWGKKTFMGREFEGILRNTYVIDPEGNIKKFYEKVNPQEHVKQLIEDLKSFL